jgi:hypothetical protein
MTRAGHRISVGAASVALALLLMTTSTACGHGWTGSVGEQPTVVWEDAVAHEKLPLEPLSRDEARRIALAHDAAHTCEQTARAMARKDPERGFAVMEQCIRRNDYSDLEGLIEGPWADRVAASPDAAVLLAHVMAVRGGDVENDLRLLRRRKMPVYSLQAALAEPQSYKGRAVILRGTARDGRANGAGRSFRLVETKVMAESHWVTAPRTKRVDVRDDGETAEPAGVDVRRGTVQRGGRSQTEKVEVEQNVSVETGRSLLARIDGDEPSLEPATDYVVVLRFEGERSNPSADGDEGDAEIEASGVVVGYFEPETGLFARLSR